MLPALAAGSSNLSKSGGAGVAGLRARCYHPLKIANYCTGRQFKITLFNLAGGGAACVKQGQQKRWKIVNNIGS